MSQPRFYHGKEYAPRAEISAGDVAKLRARAAELGLAVPALERRAEPVDDGKTGRMTRPQVSAPVRRDAQTERTSPGQMAVTVVTPGGVAVTTPQALAVSDIDLDAILPGSWLRAAGRRLGRWFK